MQNNMSTQEKIEVSVVIPTLNAASYLPELVSRLKTQSLAPFEILVMDSSSTDGSAELAASLGCKVHVIQQSQFNHGGTRNLGAKLAQGNILLFMTQDALPVNEKFIENLVNPIVTGESSAAFARQVPYPDSSPLEAFARNFNYPAVSRLKSKKDIAELGIKAFFFSNVSSAADKKTFFALNGFPDDIILNEDMVFSARVIQSGRKVAYQADSLVYHSHFYSIKQVFKRYFDIGVSIAQAKNLLKNAKTGGEGVRFATQQIRYLAKNRHFDLIPRSIFENAAKYIAFHIGNSYKKLPNSMRRKLSMHAFYWD